MAHCNERPTPWGRQRIAVRAIPNPGNHWRRPDARAEAIAGRQPASASALHFDDDFDVFGIDRSRAGDLRLGARHHIVQVFGLFDP